MWQVAIDAFNHLGPRACRVKASADRAAEAGRLAAWLPISSDRAIGGTGHRVAAGTGIVQRSMGAVKNGFIGPCSRWRIGVCSFEAQARVMRPGGITSGGP